MPHRRLRRRRNCRVGWVERVCVDRALGPRARPAPPNCSVLSRQGSGADTPHPMPVLVAGEVLGARFRLIKPIGRGGFGQVWRAEELLPNGLAIRDVALKLLSPQSDLSVWAEEA